jgi:hypothetical protein
MGNEPLNLATVLWKVLAVVALVLINGFFVAAEFALVKIRETQLIPSFALGSAVQNRAADSCEPRRFAQCLSAWYHRRQPRLGRAW